MKFALASDLHLHYGSVFLDNKENADCLILAGDVFEAVDLPDPEYFGHYVRTFFRDCAKEFKHVIWVAGNHEFYGSSLHWGRAKIRNWLFEDELLKNITFLEKESVQIGDVWVHGTTLWTDMNKNNPVTVQTIIHSGFSDFSQIEKMTAYSLLNEHVDCMEFLKNSLRKDEKNIVVTHHHPSSVGIDSNFKHSNINNAYISELGDFVFEHPEINAWCCGHIHSNSDYMMYNTRVLCNPRGYIGHESRARNFKLFYFEV